MLQDITTAIALLLLYVLYVLLPIIPAVKIYRLFPETAAWVSGPLAGVSMRVSGAFGAYVITTLLGAWLIHSAADIIGGFEKPTWTLKARVELRDENGKEDPGDNYLLKHLSVTLNPDIRHIENEYVDVNIPDIGDGWPVVTFDIPGFGYKSYDIPEEPMHYDSFRKVAQFKQPVEILRYNGFRDPYPFSPNGKEHDQSVGGSDPLPDQGR